MCAKFKICLVKDTCYRLGACVAPLGEELGEAVCAVRELLPRGEPLARQRLGAVGAGEALPVVSRVTVCHAPASDHLPFTVSWKK